MTFAYRFCRNAHIRSWLGDVPHDNCTRPDHAVWANGHVIAKGCSDTDPRPTTNMNIASQMRTDGDMDEIAYNTIMINACTGVDYAALANACTGIDDGACHNHRSFPNCHVLANYGSRMDEGCDGAADFVLDLFPDLCISYCDDENGSAG